MKTRLLFLHVLSPLHCGTGQGVGVIDLPTAREKATGLPFLPGSSLKGVLRDACSDRNKREKLFGPDTSMGDKHAGSVQFSDQRLLLLPVRSLAGTFAWLTSPYLLQRLLRDLQSIGNNWGVPHIPDPKKEEILLSSEECRITVDGRVVLEDLELHGHFSDAAKDWADWIAVKLFLQEDDWQVIFKARFGIIHDDVMNFLLETATEIFSRIRLKEDTKTVKKGGLWYEEALPAETVLSGLVVSSPVKEAGMTSQEIFQVLSSLMKRPLQFGGNATVGRGMCRLQLIAPDLEVS